MARFDGKTIFITGAARGQGREHALRFAAEGAAVIAVDVPARRVAGDDTPTGLDETAALVRELGGRVLTAEADVRDLAALTRVAAEGAAEFGAIDVVLANAAIETFAPIGELDEDRWDDVVDINLGGVYKTVKATLPHFPEAGGAIIITGSYCGIRGTVDEVHYVASKHGAVGVMKALANELGPRGIRVNIVHPGLVWTPMVNNSHFFTVMRPDIENPTKEDVAAVVKDLNPLGVPWVEVSDISNAMLFLASADARYITGVELAVDAGMAGKA